jgi:hypothetical protein
VEHHFDAAEGTAERLRLEDIGLDEGHLQALDRGAGPQVHRPNMVTRLEQRPDQVATEMPAGARDGRDHVVPTVQSSLNDVVQARRSAASLALHRSLR